MTFRFINDALVCKAFDRNEEVKISIQSNPSTPLRMNRIRNIFEHFAPHPFGR